MICALGAAGSLLDALQSLSSSKSSSATTSANPAQGAANPFDPADCTQGPVTTSFSGGRGCCASISPQTLSALIDAQSQSCSTSCASPNPSDALKDLHSQIDADGDGSITKSEFEDALGAGGTNLAAADDVFGKLDANDDGSVSLDELKSALLGAGGHHGHHHIHAAPGNLTTDLASDLATDTSTSDGSTDSTDNSSTGNSSSDINSSTNQLRHLALTLVPISPTNVVQLDPTKFVNSAVFDVPLNQSLSISV